MLSEYLEHIMNTFDRTVYINDIIYRIYVDRFINKIKINAHIFGISLKEDVSKYIMAV